VAQLVDAAEVFIEAKPSTQVDCFLDKAKHLSALHKLPRECRQAACAWLAEHKASVADVEVRVGKAKEFHKGQGERRLQTGAFLLWERMLESALLLAVVVPLPDLLPQRGALPSNLLRGVDGHLSTHQQFLRLLAEFLCRALQFLPYVFCPGA
jgi:hypothetical protein